MWKSKLESIWKYTECKPKSWVNKAGSDERSSFGHQRAVEPLLAATDVFCASKADAKAWPPDLEGDVWEVKNG